MYTRPGGFDPLGLQLWSGDHALGIIPEVPPDDSLKLFEGIFESAEYLAWSTGSKKWQLHCWGSPGCGKVMTKVDVYIFLHYEY